MRGAAWQRKKVPSFVCKSCNVKGAGKQGKSGAWLSPKDWRKHDEGYVCDECVKHRYVTRACILPIHSIVDASWEDFRPALCEAYEGSTALYNWVVRYLLSKDVYRLPDDKKMAAMPKVDLCKAYNDVGMTFGNVLLQPRVVSAIVTAINSACNVVDRMDRIDDGLSE